MVHTKRIGKATGEESYVVYHGTNIKSAENIMKTQTFFESNDNDELLGKGVYFYTNERDAWEWRHAERVIVTEVSANDDEILDFDTYAGQKLFENFIKDFRLIGLRFGNHREENQYKIAEAICRFCKENKKEIKIVLASFPVDYKVTVVLRRPRREMCVKDSSCIKILTCKTKM